MFLRRRKEKTEDHHRGNGFLSGLVLGGLLGAGIVFLLGTEEGEKVKKDAQKYRRRAVDLIDDVLEELGEKKEEVEEKVVEVRKELEEPEGRQKIVQDTQERGRRAAEAARKIFHRAGKKLTPSSS